MIRLTTACIAVLGAGGAAAQDFPLTIDHKFGTTVIEAVPERVASVDYNGADNLLALSVQPVAIRHWYGTYERAVWPWADELLEDTPAILSGDLNFEQIAASEPDVILAIWSGITGEEYEQLSKIAPVVAVPEGVGDYSLPWDQLALIAGDAIGKRQEAEAQVANVKASIAAIAERNPEWNGKTASVAYLWGDTLGAYASQDVRPLLLAEVGLQTPREIDEATTENNPFAVTISEERIDIIDSDVLIWFANGGTETIEALPLRPALRAVSEGREVFADDLLVSAFSHASLLSIPYAMERLEPMIAAAIDGDPETEVPE